MHFLSFCEQDVLFTYSITDGDNDDGAANMDDKDLEAITQSLMEEGDDGDSDDDDTGDDENVEGTTDFAAQFGLDSDE